MWKKVRPEIQHKVRGLCVRSYEGHKKGCPNFGKVDRCPPKAPLFDQVADLTKPIYMVWNKFPFGDHVRKMQEKHPLWSRRQLECCLYWQGTARKQLRMAVLEFKREFPEYLIATCPEAMGINVTKTCSHAGIFLEWPPRESAYQIVLAYITKETP